MIPLSEVADALRRKRAEVLPGMERVVGALMAENAEMSKGMLGREDNPGWEQLAESTVRDKHALGYGGQISDTDPVLRDGALRDSIESVVHLGLREIVGEVGSDLEYARDQEMGTSRIPPRPFITPPFTTIEPRAVATLGKLAQDLLNPEKL